MSTHSLSSPSQSKRRRPRRPLSIGALADAVAQGMGSPGFLLGLTVVIILWIGVNWYAPIAWHWDSHDLLLLNLMFSVLSSYSGPLILMSQSRQEARDRLSLDQDRANLRQQQVDFLYLTRQIHNLSSNIEAFATRDETERLIQDVLLELHEQASSRS